MKRCLLLLLFLLNAGCVCAQEMRVHQIPVLGERVDYVEAMISKNGVLHLVVRRIGPEWERSPGRTWMHHAQIYYVRLEANRFSTPIPLSDTIAEFSGGYSGEAASLPAHMTVSDDGSVFVAWSAHRQYWDDVGSTKMLSTPQLCVARIDRDSLEVLTKMPRHVLACMTRDGKGRLHLFSDIDDSLVYSIVSEAHAVRLQRVFGRWEGKVFFDMGADERGVLAYRKDARARILALYLLADGSFSEVPVPMGYDWMEDVVMDNEKRAHLVTTLNDKKQFVLRAGNGSIEIDSTPQGHPCAFSLDRSGGEFALIAANWRDSTKQLHPRWNWWTNAEGRGRLFLNPSHIDAEAHSIWPVRTPAGRAYVFVDTPTPAVFNSAGEGRIIAFTLPKDNGATSTTHVCLDEKGTAWISTWGGTLYEIPFALKK